MAIAIIRPPFRAAAPNSDYPMGVMVTKDVASAQLLIVDDDETIRFSVERYLAQRGFSVATANGIAEANKKLEQRGFDLILADYSMPDGTAVDLLKTLSDAERKIPVVVLTGHGSIELAVECMKLGAENFLTKPVQLPAVAEVLNKVLQMQRHARHHLSAARTKDRFDNPFLGPSAAMQKLAAVAERIAQADGPVLIHGETGSGKGVLARWLHEHSPRKDEPFVDLNCAGLRAEFMESELFGHDKGAFTGAVQAKAGLFELADHGTLFLDEIAELAPELQPKVLKAIEDRAFRRLGDPRLRHTDVRFVAATHQDLKALSDVQKFRADLYYRLNALTIRIPPLRERTEDIPALCNALLQRHKASQLRLSESALQRLASYSWPGNVRELRNVIERAVLFADGDTIEAGHIDLPNAPPAAANPSASTSESGELASSLEENERQFLQRWMHREENNVERVAQRLQMPRSTLYYRLKNLGITKR